MSRYVAVICFSVIWMMLDIKITILGLAQPCRKPKVSQRFRAIGIKPLYTVLACQVNFSFLIHFPLRCWGSCVCLWRCDSYYASVTMLPVCCVLFCSAIFQYFISSFHICMFSVDVYI